MSDVKPPGRRMIQVAAAAGVAYAVLTLLVATGLADSVDATVRQGFRPDDVWGSTQLRADFVVEALEPTLVVLLLAIVAVVTAWLRRSWGPVRLALLVLVLGVGLVALSKLVVGRPDTHGEIAELGGSYPSGHVAIVLAALGGCLLVIGTKRWWAWGVVALLDLLMGLCLLLQAAHWFTDILGGALLATCVLAVAALARCRADPGLTPSGPAVPARRRAPR